MSIEETRRMEIEFERRVQTMIPEKEYADKLDTETIDAFLNEYQQKYVDDIYKSMDQIQPSNVSARYESIMEPLLTTVTSTPSSEFNSDEEKTVEYSFEDRIDMYIRSSSTVTSTYTGSNPSTKVPNRLITQAALNAVIQNPYDKWRILRYPVAVLADEKKIDVTYDRFTTPISIEVTYYKKPARFSILTNTACQLGVEAMEDLVTGAVDLYVQYVAGAEARKRQMEQAQRDAAAEAERNAARRGKYEGE